MRVHYLSGIGFYVVVILLIMVLFSCKVTKHVDRQKVTVDSSVIRQNETLKRTLKETIESHAKEKEAWESTGIMFEDTPCPEDTSKLRAPTKIIFDNGKLKSIEGRVRSLNQSLYEKSSEMDEANARIEQLTDEKQRLEIELNKKSEKLVKEIERVSYIPLWVWLIPIAWFGREIIPFVRKRFFKQKLNI